MVSFPHCKINIGLRVLRKRTDGYHDIETCFYPIPFTDILEVVASPVFSFTSTGIEIEGDPSSNLCCRAYQLLKNDFPLPPVSIHLHKIIPSGAGLGGGSSNAAWTLRMLNEMFGLSLDRNKLIDYALRLGSDCPFFISDRAQLASGRGEQLKETPVNLKGKYLVLVHPAIHVSTVEAFRHVTPNETGKELSLILGEEPLDRWKEFVVNDFEISVGKVYPQIMEIKQTLYQQGAIYASMSGSGSSVYGIFNEETELRSHFSGSGYWSGIL